MGTSRRTMIFIHNKSCFIAREIKTVSTDVSYTEDTGTPWCGTNIYHPRYPTAEFNPGNWGVIITI